MSRLLSHFSLLIGFCLAAISSVEVAVANTLLRTADLTHEEQAYLQKNPSIRVHAESAWYPFNFIDKGRASGYSNDLIRLVAKKVGLEIEFVAGYQWSEYLAKLKNKEIDVITNIKITPSREEYAIYTRYHSLTALDGLLLNDNKKLKPDFSNIDSLAVVEGFSYQESIQNKYPRIRLTTTKDTAQAIEQLRLGHVDGVLDTFDTINFYLQGSAIKGVKNIPLYDHQIVSYSPQFMAVPKDKPILRNILDKGLLAITRTELRDLHKKWSLLSTSAALRHKNSFQEQRVTFSTRQNQYLEDHKQFKMCVDPDWLPIEAIEEGQYVGIGADFIKTFSKNITNEITLVETETWQQSLDFFAEGKCDFIPVISKTPQRRKTMSFTFPYLRFPSVLVTHQNNPPYKLQQVLHKPLGIVKGYAYKETFENLYEGVKLKEYDSIAAGFKAIRQGEIYGFIDALPVIAKKIQNTYPEFKVVEKFESEFSFSLAVAKNNIVLLDIFNKLLASIELQEQEYILNRWSPVLYEKDEDVSGYIVLIAFFTIFILFLLFGLYYSKVSNKKLAIMKAKLEALAIHDYLTELPNRTYFKAQLKKEWSRGQRSKEMLSLIIVDIDNFKDVNERFGRLEGDNCLIELSRRLQNIVKRPADILARWEGEEFIILLPDTNEEGIKAITAEIYYMLNGWTPECMNSGKSNTLSVSIGAACMLVSPTYTEKELTRRAARALYRAQDAGYNQMMIYKPGI
ncbi:transporter substrate-binding domain-containing diguanylate cyclase [Psychromonas algicola]|uniref:transporter substrate-binding domain-containing diguanylate cyclase n=1 Tax=Psychromonas algicola TaxID=2555642 RepID=UPI00106755C5|nr:transporter substrate-binding domain-containing protein [Psychromonas sp. RZ5]TEW52234.1 transporter substrate-binding domain-containing protein [Psychromonas sp. RZ5]